MSTDKPSDPLDPSALTGNLLCKLGSIAVHADELLSIDGHEFDFKSLRALLDDKEVVKWIKTMGPLLPLKRKP